MDVFLKRIDRLRADVEALQWESADSFVNTHYTETMQKIINHVFSPDMGSPLAMTRGPFLTCWHFLLQKM